MRDLPPLPVQKMPVLLTKVEALEYAAKVLDDLAMGIELAAIILGSMPAKDDRDLGSETKESIALFREGIVDDKLQVSAARQAAKAIRAMLLEERLVQARVEAGAGIGR